MAGTVAAAANGFGVVGVAPEATLVAVKMLGSDGEGTFSDIICGVDHVTRNAGTVDVVNMSLGGTDDEGDCDDGFLREAICNSVAAGITYVVSAGNDSNDARSKAPGNYPEVISVSALDDRNDNFASFSNYCSGVDVIAPGVSILSTGRCGRYVTLSGTSMAAPHAAGVAALALGVDPGLSPAGVRAGSWRRASARTAPAREATAPVAVRAGGTATATALLSPWSTPYGPEEATRSSTPDPIPTRSRPTAPTPR